MQTPNFELRQQARTSLSGKWGTAAVITLIYILISGMAGGLFIGAILITPVMVYGINIVFLKNLRNNSLEIKDLFDGFNDYGKILVAMLLKMIYTFLWSLLFVIPGIVKSYSYAMTPYILLENPTIGADEAICKSMKMMSGNKAKLFWLDLSFLGWILLAALTFGIGFLWLQPYMHSARAAFYEDLKREKLEVLSNV